MKSSRGWIAAALFGLLSPCTGPAQEREVTRYLRSYEVASGQTVDEVLCFGCSVAVAGVVTGDVVTIGGDLDISGTVDGDAVAVGGRVRLRPGSAAGGDVTAVGGSVLRDGQAKIAADVDELPYFQLPGQRSLSLRGVLTVAAINVVLALVCAAILRFRRLEHIAATLRHRTLSTIVLGLVLIGLWLSLFYLLDNTHRAVVAFAWLAQGALLLLLVSGCAGLAWLAGDLARPKLRAAVKLVLGALIWTGLLVVPLAGALAFVVALVAGLGAAARSRFGFRAGMPA